MNAQLGAATPSGAAASHAGRVGKRRFGPASSDGGEQLKSPGVTGAPLLWLRAEGLTLFATALLLYSATHQQWWLVPVLILLPDLFMVGYLRGNRIGAAVYNAGHSYPLPALVSLAGLAWHHPLVLALGLLWVAHIGMDRLAGFGLKYDSGFKRTHLGELAGTAGGRSRRVREPSDPFPPTRTARAGPSARPRQKSNQAGPGRLRWSSRGEGRGKSRHGSSRGSASPQQRGRELLSD